ncbi:MAG: beta-N-acetylhexosaminidase [Oligoflexia bacterium]|nr:beta-N-acetylhexosaminidase [Oligoflexia bacterium]
MGQTFIIGFDGKSPSADVQKFISDNCIGGVILFDRNVSDPIQLADMNNSLQNLILKSAPPMFISIDMEGGRVARLKSPFTVWPSMQTLGKIDSATLGFKFAETMGKELLSVGINMNFSPCVDIFTNPNNKVIGDRSFGSDAEVVSKMSSSVVRGFVKAGVIPCIKHFPGHGDTLIDSHDDLPVVEHDLARLEEVEFVPFKKAFRARAEFCMTAHIKLPKIDPEWPATMSHKILNDILRKHLGYRYLIITDDMEMKAITKNYPVEVAATQAVMAGCNVLLYCHTLEVQERALEAILKAVVDGKISESVIDSNYNAVLKIKKNNLSDPFKMADVSQIPKIVGHPEHLSLAKCIAEGKIPPGLTS